MEAQHRRELLDLMEFIYKTPSAIEEHWPKVSDLLIELADTSPQGFEGMATMICKHFNNAAKFKNVSVQKFELESGLIKLSSYFQKVKTS
ncbi:hypothetical protein NBRC116592_14250 [Colwellia sp. KU-HH00111]|uniref:hypothetical protein n=1 Tax=Colwellia sp. KU-HH00111 TaxID=3127652 RepID=UPI0031043ECE